MQLTKFKVIALAILCLFAIVLVCGFVVLESTGRPTASFLIFATALLGPLVTASGLGYNQLKQSEKIDTIAKNVNGINTRLFDAATGGEPLSPDERVSIFGAIDELPKHSDGAAPRHGK